jgi:hypothetical protein
MPSNLTLSKIIKAEAGWYRGDFHAHTHFSDGSLPPPDLAGVARAEGLDFFTITDHNTIDAYPHFGPPDDILIIPGIEVTLKEGHFNVFGIEGQPDWLARIKTDSASLKLQGDLDSFTRLMQRTSAEGLLNSINHPYLTPWAWLDNSADLRQLQCLEICNDPSFGDNAQANPQAVAMWTRWLNAGYRITAIGGVDYHHPDMKKGYISPQRLSQPTTYVYADNLSGAAILMALQQRRAYVSMGPQVTFEAQANGSTYGIGDDIGEVKGVIELSASLSHSHGSLRAKLVKNGKVMAEALLPAGQGNLRHHDQVGSTQSVWYRLDVLGDNGEMLVVTNPIFVGPKIEPARWTYGDFVDA